ncbi:MHC class I antigen [Mycolicibacterium canariasense]|uniref:MHC class I antigen n=1 Tax=Mycolicibacterium canariasense TaxID=228230 RepID=A0A100WHR5_MYCCR|nr:MHC class I antigen [Mycolicibacterium canariasense]
MNRETALVVGGLGGGGDCVAAIHALAVGCVGAADPDPGQPRQGAVSAVERELYVCMESTGGHCDVGFHAYGWVGHNCTYDQHDDGSHECVCGHQWTDNEED